MTTLALDGMAPIALPPALAATAASDAFTFAAWLRLDPAAAANFELLDRPFRLVDVAPTAQVSGIPTLKMILPPGRYLATRARSF